MRAGVAKATTARNMTGHSDDSLPDQNRISTHSSAALKHRTVLSKSPISMLCTWRRCHNSHRKPLQRQPRRERIEMRAWVPWLDRGSRLPGCESRTLSLQTTRGKRDFGKVRRNYNDSLPQQRSVSW